MPVIATAEGWVRVPAQKRKPSKPADPLAPYRGPLAYIVGLPELKDSSKKPQASRQLLIEPPPPVIPPPKFERARPHNPRKRVPSAPSAIKSRSSRTEVFEEADEEISRSRSYADVRSQRSASPVDARHSRAGPGNTTRHGSSSRRHHDMREESDGHQRFRDNVSEYGSRSERRHRRAEVAYYPHAHTPPPTLQPIVIYATPPTTGCGSYHHACQTHPHPQPQIRAALPPSRPSAPSVVSSRSSDSKGSRALSYQWYSATQPLNL